MPIQHTHHKWLGKIGSAEIMFPTESTHRLLNQCLKRMDMPEGKSRSPWLDAIDVMRQQGLIITSGNKED